MDVKRESSDPATLTELLGLSEVPLEAQRTLSRNKNPTRLPKGVQSASMPLEYDVFHFGHSLQLRQAKLWFPSVHLLVGVCSDDLCAQHKSRTVIDHTERCEPVRHCRRVDRVISDASRVINQALLDKQEINYVAHDEGPYARSDGSADVYDFVKRTGYFIPTRCTPGVSTSNLLERIVSGYRQSDREEYSPPGAESRRKRLGYYVGGLLPGYIDSKRREFLYSRPLRVVVLNLV